EAPHRSLPPGLGRHPFLLATADRLPGRPLRIAVLGDLDGLHTRRWLAFFSARGHEVHAISFYPPGLTPASVHVHVLREAAAASPLGRQSEQSGRLLPLRRYVPPSLERLVQYMRYARAGLARTVHEIAPDILQAHFLVEHGFYGAAVRFHPYVVSAWGSDVFRAPNTLPGRLIAR